MNANAGHAQRNVPEKYADILKVRYVGGEKKYYCCKCKVTYSTTLHAMVKHCQKHKEGCFVRCWQQTYGATDYVPDTHKYNSDTCEYTHGGNVLLRDIIVPGDVEERDGRIYCRTCKTANYKYDRTNNFKVLAGAITRFENHERRCTVNNGK